MRFGIIGHTGKPEVPVVVNRFIRILRDRRVDYWLADELQEIMQLEKERTLPLDRLGKEVDVVVSFGGDGTMLDTARHVGPSGVPILGVNIGGLGFLTEILIEEMEETVDELLRGDYQILDRMLLQVEIQRPADLQTITALNDVVIEKGEIPHLVVVSVDVNQSFLNTYRSDGLIVATPTGSTAYSLSAGGPLLSPSLHAMIITPICPHSLTVRPVVLADDSLVELYVPTDQHPLQISIDGRRYGPMDHSTRIAISRSKTNIHWVSTCRRDFFEILRTKFNWGIDQRIRKMANPQQRPEQ
ncbi:MAG TPA: NAD(+)/NADH kinase [bacterium]|nr:NAD(+)/NADH kinase [bacterium]HOX86974.1 NAD(+)/NADH kinase [bacterium]HPG46305.1 NAD(+)/NADH kinase [bacterium]HPM98501.1 NAD(+)/NADH kinase [bacterium]